MDSTGTLCQEGTSSGMVAADNWTQETPALSGQGSRCGSETLGDASPDLAGGTGWP